MREIKFRAWSFTKKKMLDRVLAGPGDPCSIVWDEEREEWLQFDDACGVIMQYTGLHDKTGREIYEGDILRSEMFPGGTLGPFYCLFTISWGDYEVTVPGDDYDETKEETFTGWRYTGTSSLPEINKITNGVVYYFGLQKNIEVNEIVGNIYEHPHLLIDMPRTIQT